MFSWTRKHLGCSCILLSICSLELACFLYDVAADLYERQIDAFNLITKIFQRNKRCLHVIPLPTSSLVVYLAHIQSTIDCGLNFPGHDPLLEGFVPRTCFQERGGIRHWPANSLRTYQQSDISLFKLTRKPNLYTSILRTHHLSLRSFPGQCKVDALLGDGSNPFRRSPRTPEL